MSSLIPMLGQKGSELLADVKNDAVPRAGRELLHRTRDGERLFPGMPRGGGPATESSPLNIPYGGQVIPGGGPKSPAAAPPPPPGSFYAPGAGMQVPGPAAGAPPQSIFYGSQNTMGGGGPPPPPPQSIFYGSQDTMGGGGAKPPAGAPPAPPLGIGEQGAPPPSSQSIFYGSQDTMGGGGATPPAAGGKPSPRAPRPSSNYPMSPSAGGPNGYDMVDGVPKNNGGLGTPLGWWDQASNWLGTGYNPLYAAGGAAALGLGGYGLYNWLRGDDREKKKAALAPRYRGRVIMKSASPYHGGNNMNALRSFLVKRAEMPDYSAGGGGVVLRQGDYGGQLIPGPGPNPQAPLLSRMGDYGEKQLSRVGDYGDRQLAGLGGGIAGLIGGAADRVAPEYNFSDGTLKDPGTLNSGRDSLAKALYGLEGKAIDNPRVTGGIGLGLGAAGLAGGGYALYNALKDKKKKEKKSAALMYLRGVKSASHGRLARAAALRREAAYIRSAMGI